MPTKYLMSNDIKVIRKEYQPRSGNVIELAKRFGVSQETIRNISNHITYKWVSD